MSYLSSACVAKFLNLLYAHWVRSQEVQRHSSSVRTQWNLQDSSTQCFSEVMVRLFACGENARWTMHHSTFGWRIVIHPGFSRRIATQCFSEVMVRLLLAAINSAWTMQHSIQGGNEFPTVQVSAGGLAHSVSQKWWSKPLVAASITDGQMQLSTLGWRNCHIPRFLQELVTQCFSEVMVKLLLAAKNSHGQCNIPPKEAGISYIQVSAGNFHTLFLRSDGQVVACGSKSTMDNAAFRPCLKETFIQSGFCRSAATRCFSEVMVVLLPCGSNYRGQCSIPPLAEGISYSQVSAGLSHTVLLRIDGQAVACGDNFSWTMQHSFIAVLAWVVAVWLCSSQLSLHLWFHNILLFLGQTVWCKWIFSLRVMQVSHLNVLDWMGWRCCDWKHKKSDRTVDVCSRVARELDTNVGESSNGFAWCTFAWYDLQGESICNTFGCDFSVSQNGEAECGFDGRNECVDKERYWNSIPMSSHRFTHLIICTGV